VYGKGHKRFPEGELRSYRELVKGEVCCLIYKYLRRI
jgi:hypothetical protein